MIDHRLTATAEQISASVTVLTAVGEIDRDSTKALAAIVPDTGKWIILDMTGVTFCDSGALNFMVQLHQQLAQRGGELAVAGAQSFVQRTIRITNLDRLFRLYPDVDEAVRGLTA